MSFLIPMNINDDIPLVEMVVIRRCLSKNGGKGWYEDECKRSAAAMIGDILKSKWCSI